MTSASPESDPVSSCATPGSQPAARVGWSRWRKFVWLVLSLFLILSLTSGLLMQTQRGSVWLLQTLSSFVPGQLRLHEVQGSLAQGLRIAEIDYQNPQLKLRLRQVQMEIQWRELLHGEVLVSRLAMAGLDLQQLQASASHDNVVQDLSLPLRLNIVNWHIARLSWQGLGQSAQELLRDAEGSLAFQQQWQWQIRASSQHLQWQSNGHLAAAAPFQLQAHWQAQMPLASTVLATSGTTASTNKQPASDAARLQFQSDWQGSLSALTAELSAQVQAAAVSAAPAAANHQASRLSLKLSLRDVLNFDTRALSRHLTQLDLHLQNFNPADWHAAWPHADWQGSVQLNSTQAAQTKAQDGTNLELHAALKNHKPQSWDQHGLPVHEIQLAGQLGLQQAELRQIRLSLAGQGQMLGQAKLAWHERGFSQIDFTQQLRQINLQALDKRLQSSQINGQIKLQGVPQAQAKQTQQQGSASLLSALQIQAQLRERQAELELHANYLFATHKLQLNQARLQAQQASLHAEGEIQLSQTQPFTAQLIMQRFDPARWLKMPAGDISAELQLAGELQKMAAENKTGAVWRASLKNLQGQLAGASLKGEAEFRQELAQALQIKLARLDWGNNHLALQADLHEHSYWPKTLNLQLQARQLNLVDQVCTALNLPYRFAGEFEVNGNWSAKQSQWQVAARQLQMRWPENSLELAELSGRADLQWAATAHPESAAKAKPAGIWQAQVQAKNWQWQSPQSPPWLSQVSQLQNLNLQVSGTPAQHQIQLQQRWQNQAELRLALQASLQNAAQAAPSSWTDLVWQAKVQEFNLDLSKPAAQANQQYSLQQTAQLRWDGQAFSLQQADWRGPWLSVQLAELKLDQQGVRSQGKINQLAPLHWLNYLQKSPLLAGDLQLSADWKLDWPWMQANSRLTRQAEINLQRQAGDILIHDQEGTRLAVALGLQQWQLQARADARQVTWRSLAQGNKLGRWQANGQFDLTGDEPINWAQLNQQASLQAEIADLQWLGPILNPGLLLRGRLQAQAQFSGSLAQPRYQAEAQGRELQLAFAAEGLSLANGELDLSLEQNKLKVQKLAFSQAIQTAPAHPRLRGWNNAGQSGSLRAQGEIDLNQERGSIRAEMQQFPLLQSKDRYLVVSGNAEISEARQIWELSGKLQADAAYFKLPKMPAPSLSSDVVVHKALRENTSKARQVFKTRLDFSFDLGPRFVFVGRGLDTGLSGSLRLRGQDGAPLQASGSIRTEGGNYEAYGQKLEIARGILNFQDSPANPALNVLALRRGQAVEAGVEISGTVAKPKVSLYSEPSVPDAEKLSWLVLGRGSEQLAAGDASLLMSAAGAIFGGEGQRNIPKQIVNGLGFDDFSIGASSAQASRLPSQTVAGSTGNHSSSNDQVLSLGKRLSPDLVLSVERGLADASGALKLSWQLTRRISINARTGNESALDVNYTFAFH